MNTEPEKRAEYEQELAEAIRFHGHLCPGLVIGYRAVRAALQALGVSRAEDEELVTIVENDSCSVDAVQWLTGCTFGKGNLVFRDYGKQVFTFIVRSDGRALRLALKPDTLSTDVDREERIRRMLAVPAEELFDIKSVTMEVPEPAHIRDTLICDSCGEGAMATRTVARGGRTLCIPCSLEQDT